MGSRTRSSARRSAGRPIGKEVGAFERERSTRQCTRSRRDARISYTFALFYRSRRKRGGAAREIAINAALRVRVSRLHDLHSFFKFVCVNSDVPKRSKKLSNDCVTWFASRDKPREVTATLRCTNDVASHYLLERRCHRSTRTRWNKVYDNFSFHCHLRSSRLVDLFRSFNCVASRALLSQWTEKLLKHVAPYRL